MKVKTFEKADTPSKKGHKGVKKGYKESQDLREGVRTIQEGVQRESRRNTLGVKTFEEADTPAKKGYKGSQERAQWQPRPSTRRTHHPRRGRQGVKTLRKLDMPSKKRYKGSQ